MNAVSEWDFSHRWRTWWIHPDQPVVPCDGFENGHWRQMCETPDLVNVPGPGRTESFAVFVASHDVEEDRDARDLMKFWVMSAGYVRTGLCQADLGYVDGMDVRSIRKAVRFLARESGGLLERVDIRLFPADYGAYAVTDMSDEFLVLEGKRISGFLAGGPLPDAEPAVMPGP